MRLGKTLGSLLAGAALFSAVQAPAKDLEIRSNDGAMTQKERQDAEATKKNIKVIRVSADYEDGPDRYKEVTVNVFGGYGLGVRHCAEMSKPGKKSKEKIVFSDTGKPVKTIYAPANKDMWILEIPKEMKNNSPLYRFDDNLLKKLYKEKTNAFWIGFEQNSYLPGILYRSSSTFASDVPGKIVLGDPKQPSNTWIDEGSAWTISKTLVSGTSGSLIQANLSYKEKNIRVPIGIVAGNMGKSHDMKFYGCGQIIPMWRYINVIENHERKTGERKVEILPLPK